MSTKTDDNSEIIFSFLLRDIIHALRLKDIEFAQKTGIKKATLSSYVNGKSLPDWFTLRAIVLAFNVDPRWLLTGEGEMFSSSPSPSSPPAPGIPPEETAENLTPEQRNMMTYVRIQTQLGASKEQIAQGVDAIIRRVGGRREYPTVESPPNPGYNNIHDEFGDFTSGEK